MEVKDKKTKIKVQKKKKLSLVPPVQEDSLLTDSIPEDKPLLSSDQESVSRLSSKGPQRDLKTNLLHLEEEAAFFHFALKEIHDLTG